MAGKQQMYRHIIVVTAAGIVGASHEACREGQHEPPAVSAGRRIATMRECGLHQKARGRMSDAQLGQRKGRC